MLLKVRSEQMDEWILHTMNVKTFEGIVDKEFLEIMSPLGMAKIDCLNLLYYVGDVAKGDIGPINVDQQKTGKATQYIQETL